MDHLFQQDFGKAGDWVLALLILALWLSAGWILARFLLRRLGKWAARSSFQFESTLIHALPLPLYLLIFIGGVNLALEFAPLSPAKLLQTEKIFRIALLSAGVFVVDRLFQGLLRDFERRHEDFKDSHFLFSSILRVGAWAIGAMLILDQLGVTITPLLASLGVGLAVALALQSTLANFFSGMYLILDKPIRVGQFIKLETGDEGYVEVIGWRSTRVRLLANNTVVIPNTKLAENQILNYYLPDSECAVLVEVGVDYGSDLSRVEAITVQVARHIQKTVEGAVPSFDPFIRLHTFADSSINFTVILRAQEFVANYLIKHEFIKALHRRYREEGITIPFPQRTVEIKGSSLKP